MASTKWTCRVDPGGRATLQCELTEDDGRTNTFRTRIRGVCYSPAPINGRNDWGPALGDWYWDSSGAITGWQALWHRDRPQLDRLHLNSLRLYCMLSRQIGADGSFPSPWNSGHRFTHKTFLDELCFDAGVSPLDRQSKYALVGIPLPARMLWKEDYARTSQAEKDYWYGVLEETAQEVGRHPGVIGFTIQNEQDNADVCYGNPDRAQFWWSQVERLAGIVKKAAPDKLVGMATHDDPNIPLKALAYMEKCPSIDFWGVNTYQTANFGSVFEYYRRLEGGALKPIVLTEWGMPATGHRRVDTATETFPESIYEDAATRSRAAKVVRHMVPQAYDHPLCIGLYYFEYCDEWWNQPNGKRPPEGWKEKKVDTWWGGEVMPGFPNGYWDNDGFGLHSIRRGGTLPNNAPIWSGNGPTMPIDIHTERTELTNALAGIFDKVRQHPW